MGMSLTGLPGTPLGSSSNKIRLTSSCLNLIDHA